MDFAVSPLQCWCRNSVVLFLFLQTYRLERGILYEKYLHADISPTSSERKDAAYSGKDLLVRLFVTDILVCVTSALFPVDAFLK